MKTSKLTAAQQRERRIARNMALLAELDKRDGVNKVRLPCGTVVVSHSPPPKSQ